MRGSGHDGAMARAPRGGSNGRPPRTSREEILQAAHRLVDQDGWEKLTIRRLAAEVGTSPATVYYHVRDREDLLVQMLKHGADQLPRPELPADPRERLVMIATVMHDELAARPWITEILTADDVLGDSALWLVEGIVAAAIEAGADQEAAVRLYRHIWYYTAGEILIRSNRTRRDDQREGPSYREQAFARIDREEYPQLARLADRWIGLTAQNTFAEGLIALVDGLLPRNSQRS